MGTDTKWAVMKASHGSDYILGANNTQYSQRVEGTQALEGIWGQLRYLIIAQVSKKHVKGKKEMRNRGAENEDGESEQERLAESATKGSKQGAELSAESF